MPPSAAASSKADQAAITAILAGTGWAGFAAAWLRAKGLDWAAAMFTRNRDARS